MKRAILLSGGMDSTALAYWIRPQVAITVDYGQRSASGEARSATSVARALGIDHHLVSADCSSLGYGDLAGKSPIHNATTADWWPFRNQLLATLAGPLALVLGVGELVFGSVKSDQHFADGTSEFFQYLSRLMELQEGHISVTAPAVDMTTEELVRASEIPLEILNWSHSCHRKEFACGRCRGCRKSIEVVARLSRTPSQ